MVGDKTLVTVIVITYNSSRTVLQTLESVKKQTYENIQLVISDDGSKDDTIALCEDWLKENKEHFASVDLVKTEINTGTPANCNRAYAKSKGEWIKLIAGDDLLLPNCVQDFMTFVSTKPECDIACSKFSSFVCEDSIISRKMCLPKKQFLDRFYYCKTPKEQLYLYIETTANITPSLFYRKSLVEAVGGFNEDYWLFEDTPFVVEVLKSNHRLFYLDKETVLYRKDTPSVTRDVTHTTFFRTNFIDCNLKFRKEKIYPLYKWYDVKFWVNEYSFRLLYYFTVNVLRNRRTKLNQVVYNLVKALNPYYLIQYVTK